ncbi:MmcQ/YjbR family DNA-binding protein [soil metagenome]
MKLDDAAKIASALPGVIVGARHGNRTWAVGDRVLGWQRPFSKADLKRFGDDKPPAGDILAVIVENLDAKEALLEIAPPGLFTIPHFNGYAAVLIELKRARVRDVRAALQDAYRVASVPRRRQRDRVGA